MSTFSSLQQFIDTITARFNVPRRSATSEGVDKQSLLQSLLDVGIFVSETNSETFIQESIATAQAHADSAHTDLLSGREVLIQTNAAKAITENLKTLTEIAAAGRTLDFIPLGTWNAATNTPALTTNASAVPAGKGYEVAVPGTQGITGTATLFTAADKVISNGTTWYVRRANKEDSAKNKYQDAIIDELFTISKGDVVQSLTLPLTDTRYTSTGGNEYGYASSQADNFNRSYTITGFPTSGGTYEGISTWFDTGIANLLTYERIVLQATITETNTTNPCFGLGYMSDVRIGYAYRKDGSLYNFETDKNTQRAPASTDRAFIVGDVITVEIINRNGILTFVTSKNGVYASEYTISKVPNGNMIVFMRGSLGCTYTLSTKKKSTLTASFDAVKAYSVGLVNEVKEAVFAVSSGYLGVASPVSGTGTGVTRTRVAMQAIPGQVEGSIIKITSMQVQCSTAGPGIIYILKRNLDGIHFDIVYEFAYGFTVGSNIIPGSFFGDIALQPGYYFGLNSPGVVEFSGVTGLNGDSVVMFSGVTGENSVSNWQLQFKANFSISTPIKPIVTALAASNYYVSDGIGNDSNNGLTSAFPFKTINKAITSSFGKSKVSIMVAGGDYYETLNFANMAKEDITLTAADKAVVRVMGSEKLNGWVKTAGYSNIYEASFAGSIPAWNHPPGRLPNIFEDKNPSKPILPEEVHPLQKGLTHRLPYTEITAIAAGADLPTTLTSLDATPGRHFLSGGKLYLHASVSNPLTNGFDYHIPVRPSNVKPSTREGSLTLDNMMFLFSTSGFISIFRRTTRYMCTSLGIVDTYGAWRDDAGTIISYKDEAGGASNDGFNQHFDSHNSDYATQDVRRGVGLAIYFDPWIHDVGDDTMSCHQRGEVSVFGGLGEYCGDGGFVPANGGTYRLYNVHSRNNQLASDASQAGFGTANSSAGTGRNQTTLLAYNCISENDKWGFAAKAEAGNIVELHNCTARNASLFNYIANYGTIKAYNCLSGHTNPTKHKSVAVGATINIINDAALT